jgi:hypothetical protein
VSYVQSIVNGGGIASMGGCENATSFTIQ